MIHIHYILIICIRFYLCKKIKSIDLNSGANDVSGMLLYAQTDEKIQPNNTYMMSGNKISVRTLNLNCDFAEIVAQLDWIIEEHFGNT